TPSPATPPKPALPTRTSSPSGKTPTPTSPSSCKPNPNSPSSRRPHSLRPAVLFVVALLVCPDLRNAAPASWRTQVRPVQTQFPFPVTAGATIQVFTRLLAPDLPTIVRNRRPGVVRFLSGPSPQALRRVVATALGKPAYSRRMT